MISNLDPASELFLANLNRVEQRIASANQQVTSGSKISVASDAPDQIATLLQLRAEQQHNSQVQSNLGLATADANAADDALSGAIKLMDSALTLASQGTNTVMDVATRQGLALQVQSLQDQMVGASQTTVRGRYIFGGDQATTAPYSLDLAGTNSTYAGNGVDQLTSAQSTQQIEDPAGGSFAAQKTAQEIFDDRNSDGTAATDNVFAALNNLQLALASGDPNQVLNTISSLKAASAHLNAMESFYGGVQNRIQSASDYASNRDTQLQTQISNIQDADVTSAALELTQNNTQLQASLQMQAQMPHTSLFNYLG